jgi:hypothetical protein
MSVRALLAADCALILDWCGVLIKQIAHVKYSVLIGCSLDARGRFWKRHGYHPEAVLEAIPLPGQVD